MSTPPQRDNRPRWSLTWLLRVQHVGRDRRERAADHDSSEGRAADHDSSEGRTIGKWVLIVVGSTLLIVGALLGVWLGVLPR